MKEVITGAIVLWSLLPAHTFAQRVSIHAGSGPATNQFANFGNFGLPPVGPIPPLGLTTPGFSSFSRFGSQFRHSGFGFGGFGGNGFPGFYGGYGGYYGDEYQSAPNVIVLMPQQQSPPPPPPEPARPEIREYKQPDAAGGQASAQQPSAEFSIVSKDGSVRSAIAVWVQGGVVHYVAPDGTDGELPLGSIDREATRRANAEKHLTLPLPAPSAPAQRR